MDNFLILLQDMLLKSSIHELTVLGNGPSRSDGLLYADDKKQFCIVINNATGISNVFMAIATKHNFALELNDQLDNGIPIFVPDTLNLGPRYTSLPESSLEYIEGIIPTQLANINFRRDFVLLTILRILESALNVNSLKNYTPMRVNLFGFDFELPGTLNEVPKTSESLFLSLLLDRQKSLFEELLKAKDVFKNIALQLGSRKFEPAETLELEKTTATYSGKEISLAITKNNDLMQTALLEAKNGKVQVVAELTNNHLGDTNRLERMVRAAKNQGANIIKIQKRDPLVLYTEEERNSIYRSPFGDTLGEYRFGVELNVKQIQHLTILCSELEIPWFTSVLDEPSLKLMEQFNPICVKAPSTISDHRNFLKKLSDSAVEWIIVSSGGTDSSFIDWIKDSFSSKKLILLQCTSSYPTAPEDCNIRVLSGLLQNSQHKDLMVGYSSHDAGSLASQLAIGLGAVIIEKHVKLGSVDWIHFDGVALDLEDGSFGQFIRDLRDASTVLGSESKKVLPAEHHKYKPNVNHN